MSILSQKRITKKINNAYIVWFGESNHWMQLEEPAWFIYRNYNSGVKTETISQKFSKRYHLNIDESIVFVRDIIIELDKLSSDTILSQENLSIEQFESPAKFFSRHTYKINQKILAISFESRLLEYMIHPSLAHLEIIKKTKPHFILEIFSLSASSILKIAGKAWAEVDVNSLKRRLFIEITGLLYGKSDKDWLSFVHGSAVSNQDEAIILSTACGSGKSTLAALLCKEGLKLLSDDFVAIDARFCKAYPFPAALSVKDGSFPVLQPLYNQLENSETFHFKNTNKTVKYLRFPDEDSFYKPLPVRILVFVKYNPAKPFSFRKVPTLEAFRRFNEEAWVSHLPANARKFIKWFPGLKCYELEFSDNKRAVKVILGLFGANLETK